MRGGGGVNCLCWVPRVPFSEYLERMDGWPEGGEKRDRRIPASVT